MHTNYNCQDFQERGNQEKLKIVVCGELIANKLGRSDFRTELEFSSQTLQKAAVVMRKAGLVLYLIVSQTKHQGLMLYSHNEKNIIKRMH